MVSDIVGTGVWGHAEGVHFSPKVFTYLGSSGRQRSHVFLTLAMCQNKHD